MSEREYLFLRPGSAGYPEAVRERLAPRVPTITALGNLDLLQHKKLALFCSVRCPGRLILQTYDLARALRDAGVAVAGGFHTPMEKECLALLLRGTQPVVVCPARGIEGMRLPRAFLRPLDDGRLVLLSPFDPRERRMTAETALFRNRFVAALADAIVVAYAEPSSKTAQFCREALIWQKPVYTLESDANRHLVELGAEPVGVGMIASLA